MTKAAKIFMFTALACEAKPLIAHFKLKKNIQYRPFAIYSNDQYCLTVAGVGKVAVAAAVAYTLALLAKDNNPILINIGIAGHRDLPVASIRLADKIIDGDNGRCFYPSLIYKAPCQTTSVTTVSCPDTDYFNDGLIDMEVSAFYQTAVNFTGAELVQCLKIVSDNEQMPADKIKPNKVSELISGAIEIVEQLITELMLLQSELDQPEPDGYRSFLKQLHFTVSEQNQLLQLLKQYQLLEGPELPKSFESAKGLMTWLQQANQEMALAMRLN
jgi:hypothetical protein